MKKNITAAGENHEKLRRMGKKVSGRKLHHKQGTQRLKNASFWVISSKNVCDR